MKDFKDNEFSAVSEEVFPAAEEFSALPKEIVIPKNEFPEATEISINIPSSENDKSHSKHELIKKLMLAPAASAAAAVVVVCSSFGVDPLGDDFLGTEERPTISSGNYSSGNNSESSSNSSAEEPQEFRFPELDNLAPDYFSEIDARFVRFEYGVNPNDWLYTVAGKAWGASEVSLEGVSYDPASNTLTLKNFSGPTLNVNVMGNGFTINLVGENRLETLCVWGYGYGGSVKITGSGSLIINEDSRRVFGIELKSEVSGSCLMIDKGVRVEVFGSEAAVVVHETLLKQGIIVHDKSSITGGVPARGDFYVDDWDDRGFDYSIIDALTGVPSKHVVFG